MEMQGIPVAIANLAIHRHREEEMNQERMKHDQMVQEATAERAREANKGKAREVVPDSEEEDSEELASSASEECASRPDSAGVGGSSNPSPQIPIHSSSNSEFANTRGLDAIDLNNDEIEEIPQESVKWEEDEILISAWLNVSDTLRSRQVHRIIQVIPR
ncbi:hypothetical protein PIB30_023893 [Stylosanthes scabra]|uniref:Uncharacterized protein n=1 Tax=Stylosanthes scabra TaxID=79078 RepID=A0ABU6T9B8_9FABA|nr:hypothetical protein [Stylosanthes scabra]